MKKSIIDKDDFIRKSNIVHNEKYDYSKVDYINTSTKVCITCLEHGDFFQTPYIHAIKGCGCPKCAKNKQSLAFSNNVDDIISKFIEKHGELYDYRYVNEDYSNMHRKVRIICHKHGVFSQTPHNHLKGNGCPKCYMENKKNGNPKFLKNFIEKAEKIHNKKYKYDSEYFNSKSKVKIFCPIHGYFEQRVDVHLSGCGCPICANHFSKDELEIYEYVKSKNNNVIHSEKSIINPYEIDIFIPNKHIGIEYNGLYWHSEENGKDKYYHLKKLKLCNNNNVKLIQIFEDEWLNKKEIVLNKIDHLLGCSNSEKKIYGRKCLINEINKNEAKNFLNKYHIQGFVSSSVYLGAYYNNELVAVMTFKRELNNSLNYELNRFASNYNYICCGVGGKLFNFFVKNYKPNTIKSFADRRWTINEDSNIYIKLGFKFDKYIKPDYRYYNQCDGVLRQHKFNFRKQILHKKYGLPLTMTENEMTKELGYYKIWDCGLIKYVWKK